LPQLREACSRSLQNVIGVDALGRERRATARRQVWRWCETRRRIGDLPHEQDLARPSRLGSRPAAGVIRATIEDDIIAHGLGLGADLDPALAQGDRRAPSHI
jgi:hypothetical protein